MSATTVLARTGVRARRRRRHDLPAYVVLLAPAVLFLLLTSLAPLLFTLGVSFFTWFLNRPTSQPVFVGLANYGKTLEYELFQTALQNTAVFSLIGVALEFVLGLGVALLVTGEGMGMRLARSILLIPMIMTPVVVGVTWRILLNQFGLINYLLGLAGIPPVQWLAESDKAMISVIMVDVWEWTPFVMIVMVAALASLPGEPFRAARVDGASSWQIFWHITLPMLRPVIVITLLMRLIDAVKVFDTIFILTQGGPGYATEMLSSYIYKQGLRYFNMGFAAAGSWIFLLLVVGFALLVILQRRRAERL